MNTRRLSQTVALLGLSTLLGASAAKACKYCWAAEQAAAADYKSYPATPAGTASALTELYQFPTGVYTPP